MPKRISRSVTPRCGGWVLTGAVVVAATAADGAMMQRCRFLLRKNWLRKTGTSKTWALPDLLWDIVASPLDRLIVKAPASARVWFAIARIAPAAVRTARASPARGSAWR